MAISRYDQPVQNTLEQYVPLPFQEMLATAGAIQQRGDLADMQNMQTEIGLGSMEALAPAYQQFRDTYVADYKKQAADLLDKVGGNTSNPEFIRGIKRLNTQFTSDPRLQIIKQGNEQIKQNQQMAAKLQAEGRLFINPQFTGADESGRLIANPGQVQGVNTLDEWAKAGAIAHSSIEDNGRGWKTNKANLDRWKQAVMSDVDGQRKLIQAYISQGYTPEQAQRAVQTEIQGLINQYGVRSDRDHSYDYLQLARAKAAKEDAQQPNLRIYDSSPGVAENIDLKPGLSEKYLGGKSQLEKILDQQIESQGGGTNIASILKGVKFDSNGRAVANQAENNLTEARQGNLLSESQLRTMTPEQIKNYNSNRLKTSLNNALTGKVKTNQEFENFKNKNIIPELGNQAYNSQGSLKTDKELAETYDKILRNSIKDFYYYKKPRFNSQEMSGIEKVIESTISENTPIYEYNTNNIGKMKQYNKKDLKVKSGTIRVNGFNPYSHAGLDNGSIMITYENNDGNDKTGVIELDKSLKGSITPLLKAQRALQSFSKTNEELLRDPSLTIRMGDRILSPQRGATNDGKFGIVYVDSRTGEAVASMNDVYNQVMADIADFYKFNLTK